MTEEENKTNKKNNNLKQLIKNTASTRRALLDQLLNPDKDINYECGYPLTITMNDYKSMYGREGVAARVVKLLPDESWSMEPIIEENKDADETKFEKEWKDLEKEKHLFHYLHRVDVLSGIGRFGILLLGISDGKELKEPVAGINLKTGESEKANNYKLLYLKPFDESVVKIKEKEVDVKSPRYGLPTIYTVAFEDIQGDTTSSQSKEIHWTRVLHVADNREVSEIHGIPRMKSVYNRLLDLRKIVAGSGEMFWKGAFPGFAIKLAEGVTLTDDEKTALKEELQDYQDSLQRWISLGGAELQELRPQISDPKGHIETQLKYISLTLGIPYRIFTGSESAHLASSQDSETWNKRVMERQNSYLTPHIVRLLIDRLIIFGVLSEVEEYFVEWPDLNDPGEKDAAEIAAKKTEAFAKYVSGSVDELIPPKEFLTMIMGMTDEDAEAIIDAAMDYGEDLTQKEDEEEAKKQEAEALAADEATARQIQIEQAKAAAKVESQRIENRRTTEKEKRGIK